MEKFFYSIDKIINLKAILGEFLQENLMGERKY